MSAPKKVESILPLTSTTSSHSKKMAQPIFLATVYTCVQQTTYRGRERGRDRHRQRVSEGGRERGGERQAEREGGREREEEREKERE